MVTLSSMRGVKPIEKDTVYSVLHFLSHLQSKLLYYKYTPTHFFKRHLPFSMDATDLSNPRKIATSLLGISANSFNKISLWQKDVRLRRISIGRCINTMSRPKTHVPLLVFSDQRSLGLLRAMQYTSLYLRLWTQSLNCVVLY